ncbi:MAG: FAD-binding oxidoreductase [Actinomycetota bacterium]|nr:FAD-binding oxidoreductase [Actinomycetota bacterium]
MEQQAATTHAVLELEGGFTGEVIRPGDSGYDEARAVYNAMIDKRPALIVRPAGAADVIDAVNLAREKNLPVAVRCGGHSIAGKGVVDGGILINLSSLKGVRLDRASRSARANAGALWGEFDRETQLFGLATPGGRVTTTGVGGFTLGGGYGWLSPKYGLTCDNLISVDVVTADGRLVTANESENADLFWAVRGGSSNFGIVTSYEFRLHPLGPMVLAGLLLHPIDEAKDVLRAHRDYVETAPEELATATAIFMAPPAPFVPEHLHGKPVLGMIAIYIGEPDEGRDIMAPVRELGPPAADLIQPMPYTTFQTVLDPTAPWGWLNYNRGLHLALLSDDAIDTYVERASEIAFDSPMSVTIIFRHGGAVSRVPDDATAASHRDAAYLVHPIACWQDPAETERHIDWVRGFSEAMRHFTTGGVYLNMEPDVGEERVRAGYGAEKYAKLVALKDKWDPRNLFRVNQNIKPSRTSVFTP